MPKKQQKNAFYFYMLDFKEQQRKKGVNYANLAEVSVAAGLTWTNEPPLVRAKFEEMAKKQRQPGNVPVKKYTSTGISFTELERKQREIREAEEAERMDIQDMIKIKFLSNSLYELDIYVMDVNFFCLVNNNHLIGESTLIRFNLIDGIKDSYHELINPGKIPIGYAYDVKQGCQDFGLMMPDETVNPSNYMELLAKTLDYLKQHDRKAKYLPPIFTMPEKTAPVQDFVLQMCRRAGEDETLFRIYRLDTMFFSLINTLKSAKNEGFPKESLALNQLTKDLFKYTPGLGCQHHEDSDKSQHCTASRAKRWAYTILDSCCPLVGIDLVPGKHLPPDYDIDGILTYKEQKRVRAGPSVAGAARANSSCNTSSINDSFADTTASSLDTTRKEKRTNAPLRMPKGDYSQVVRIAPNLDNGPVLNYAGVGRGRGSSSRNLVGQLSNLKLDKE